MKNRKLYILGGLVGMMLGISSVYLYTRAAGEDKEIKLTARDVLGLAFIIVRLLRQFAEAGKPAEHSEAEQKA